MKKIVPTAIILCLLVITGCSRVQVSHDFRQGTDFGRYHTYQWKVAENTLEESKQVSNSLMHERIKTAIDGAMLGRGYSQLFKGDLEVSYDYSIKTRIESRSSGPGFGFGFGRRYHFGHVGWDYDVDVEQYDVGVLVISLYDSRTGKLIWQGTGSEIVRMHWNPEQKTAYIQRMVNSILNQFPPS